MKSGAVAGLQTVRLLFLSVILADSDAPGIAREVPVLRFTAERYRLKNMLWFSHLIAKQSIGESGDVARW